jgi:glycosyltransferase involved in cell wall biosynthesis
MVATVASTIRHFLRPYAVHFRALGWRVDAAANGATRDAVLARDFDHVYELPLSRSVLDLGDLRRGADALSKVLEMGPDIVHVHTPIAAFMTRFVVHRMTDEGRPRVAYTAHGFHFQKGGHPLTNAVFLTAERVAGRWTDRLVVINDEDEQAARRYRIVPQSRLVRMPGIGLDTSAYSRAEIGARVASARQELGMDADRPLFVAVGELTPRKRQRDVIAALGLMRHAGAQLVLAGDGPDRARLEAQVARMRLGNRVRFPGSIEDVRPIVASATALVLASTREGLNRSVMEALSLEAPVVASTARGNAELLGADRGLLFPIGDVTALAAHLDWLIDHPVERLEMGRRGRARMVERYDVRRVIQLHEAMYEGMFVVRGAPRRGRSGTRRR